MAVLFDRLHEGLDAVLPGVFGDHQSVIGLVRRNARLFQQAQTLAQGQHGLAVAILVAHELQRQAIAAYSADPTTSAAAATASP